jgi:hypothetical protein
MDNQDNGAPKFDFHADYKHLTPTRFEEFCYELLQDHGFVNVDWRKGTPKDSSPADGGRDIECWKNIVDDVDGHTHQQKWFIDCKHYEKAVPPDALSATLAWADAEKPDVVLFICSGYLSNPAKDNLKKQSEHKSYKIRYWEYKELERLLFDKGRLRLAQKYQLIPSASPVMLHPAHFYFMTQPRHYSQKEFRRIVNSLPVAHREAIVFRAQVSFFGLKVRPQQFKSETLGEMIESDLSLAGFWKSFNSYEFSANTLMLGLLTQCLMWKFYRADTTNREFIEKNLKDLIISIREDSGSPLSADERAKMISDTENQLSRMDQTYKEAYDEYVDFCNEVLVPLIKAPDEPNNTPEGFFEKFSLPVDAD